MLIRLALTRNYDYDEVSHAHMAWLFSVGDKPYQDFAANHFPFFWFSLSPVMRLLPQSPLALVFLRAFALSLNLIFVAAFGALICFELPPTQRIWGAACFAAVVFFSPVVHFLIEFRPDALANSALFGSLLWLKLQRSNKAVVGFMIGFGMGFATLVNTKYLLFPVVLGLVTLALNMRHVRNGWPFALAACAGYCATLAGGVCLLHLLQLPIGDAWRMVVTYNSAVEKTQHFGFGLADALAQTPLCLFYILPGAVWCVVLFTRRGWRPTPFQIAVFAFLVLDIILTTRPWKQYVASWLLLAGILPACSFPQVIAALERRFQTGIAACCLAGAAVLFALAFRPDAMASGRATQDQAMDYVLKHVPPGGYVISSFVVHPIFRRDTFFKTVYDASPDGTDGIEAFMRQAAPPPLNERFTLAGYDKDLQARPPDLFVVDAYETEDQRRALDEYFSKHSSEFAQGTIPGTHLRVVLRKTDIGAKVPLTVR